MRLGIGFRHTYWMVIARFVFEVESKAPIITTDNKLKKKAKRKQKWMTEEYTIRDNSLNYDGMSSTIQFHQIQFRTRKLQFLDPEH